MAKGNLAPCLKETLAFEGGFSMDRRDPGNWTGGAVGKGDLKGTNKGIAASAYPNLDIPNLSQLQIETIYRQKYWTPLRGDDLPRGADLVIFDFGVNSGIGRSAKITQAIVGSPIDGRIGPVTLAILAKMPSRDFIKKLCAKRLGFVQSLNIWKTFGKGWSARIAKVEATALSWVLTKPQLDAEAKAARTKAVGQGAGTGGVVTGGGAATQSPDLSAWPWWGIALVAALVAAPFIIRTVINSQRAVALGKVAKEA